ncbi:hypothetical protein H5410_054497 [Solanum commersonii]|uniref:Uncharacterized protein n=1 Tax=Solanum commersonii TaxID=4109 RepID=A0A9J5WF32_SOLCO|nr:hypothetical protein H5410_054497 [Solanum commersonii]
MEPVGPHDQNGPFSRSNKPQSIWPSRPKRPIFKVKQALEPVNPSFCQFSCAIVHGFFADLEFEPHFCQNFSWTSVKTLVIMPVGPHGQNGPLSRSNEPRSR